MKIICTTISGSYRKIYSAYAIFVNFLPAASDKAKHRMQSTIRSWRLHMKTWTTLENIAKKINPIVRGWLEYYGRFQKTELTDPLRNITKYLMRWVCRKYTSILGGRRAKEFLGRVRERSPDLFVHWQHVFRG